MSSPPTPPMPRPGPYWFVVGTFACFMLALIGWKLYERFLPRTIAITIDNALDGPVEVTLDGDAVTVEPGGKRVLRCRHGERHLRATRDGQTVFALAEVLRPPDRAGDTRRFLLNLAGAGRYRVYDVAYGMSLTPNMPRFRIDFPGWGEADRRREQVRELVERVKLVEMPPWSDVSGYDVVLDRPPRVVQGMIVASKRVLAKVGREDHDRVKAAAANKEPTEPQVAELRATVERLLRDEGPE